MKFPSDHIPIIWFQWCGTQVHYGFVCFLNQEFEIRTVGLVKYVSYIVHDTLYNEMKYTINQILYYIYIIYIHILYIINYTWKQHFHLLPSPFLAPSGSSQQVGIVFIPNSPRWLVLRSLRTSSLLEAWAMAATEGPFDCENLRSDR